MPVAEIKTTHCVNSCIILGFSNDRRERTRAGQNISGGIGWMAGHLPKEQTLGWNEIQFYRPVSEAETL